MASPTSTSVKKALACYGHHKREILFNANVSAAQELNNLRAAFLQSYGDVAELRNAQSTDLIVQAKSELWSGQFIDVQDQYIPNHSVVNVILATPAKAVERASEKVSSGSETIRKLEKSESEALSQLFPSSSTSRKRPIPTFDPKGECAAASQQRKKKASGNSGRPSNVVVVVMPKLVTNVPRGRHRTQLETLGRKKTLKFTRNMTTQQVSDTIRRGFHTILIQGTSWKYLDCVDNKLSVSNEQSPDGNAIVGRKSALYLVQTTEEVHVQDSTVTDASVNDYDSEDSSSDDALPAVNLGRIARVNSLSSAIGESSASLIRQQDREYELSLQRDREKVEDAERKERELEMLEQIRQTLLEQQATDDRMNLKIAFKLPDGSKCEGQFAEDSSAKDLYEFVFVRSGMNTAFTISTTFPRSIIPVSSLTTIAELQVDSVLAVTVEENSPHPLSYLSEEDYNLPKGTEQPFLSVVAIAKTRRESFMKGMDLHYGSRAVIVRDNEYESVMKLYQGDQLNETLSKYPFRMRFVDEKGIDLGGVCRDAFTAFFGIAYRKFFDGSTLVTPAIHPGTDVAALKTMGCIISHAYLVSGILPVKVAFPCLAQVLLPKDNLVIPDDVYVKTFFDSLSVHDQEVFKVAYEEIKEKRESFSADIKSSLEVILSLYGCRELPKPKTLQRLTLQLAKYQFELHPSAAISAMKSGVAVQHLPFWKSMTLAELYRVYCAMSVTPAKVMKMLENVEFSNKSEERVLGYLRQYIGNITNEQLCDLLRFITGCGLCIGPISVTFNGLEGFERRPMSHTCSNTLDLSSTYGSYLELKDEFDSILKNVSIVWKMDTY